MSAELNPRRLSQQRQRSCRTRTATPCASCCRTCTWAQQADEASAMVLANDNGPKFSFPPCRCLQPAPASSACTAAAALAWMSCLHVR